jgi:vancomycin resistance protein VanW
LFNSQQQTFRRRGYKTNFAVIMFGQTPQPIRRTRLRHLLGRHYFTLKRRMDWYFGSQKWAINRKVPLYFLLFQHQSVLLRRLKDVDMHLQHNKIANLRLAIRHLDGIVIRPGETFSFWYLVGRPTAKRGFKTGLALENGRPTQSIGGGLCQLGNLIYWMALHTELTVAERWRHSYDVFPDENRTLPFGSGATLAYNYIDLQLRNDTQRTFQVCLWLDDTHLHGAIRSDAPAERLYTVYEQVHHIEHQPWGGYTRHNRIARRITRAADQTLLADEVVAENHAVMMYQPFLEHKTGA